MWEQGVPIFERKGLLAELFYLLSKASANSSNFTRVPKIPISSSSSLKLPATLWSTSACDVSSSSLKNKIVLFKSGEEGSDTSFVFASFWALLHLSPIASTKCLCVGCAKTRKLSHLSSSAFKMIWEARQKLNANSQGNHRHNNKNKNKKSIFIHFQ